MLNKLIVLYYALYGYLIKWMYDLHLLSMPKLGSRPTCDAIVSLTSYGRRVKDGIVCYSIYSILRQTLQPKKIILWLDDDSWDSTNLPTHIAALQNLGIDIAYTPNMRSYGKLLPTLKRFPQDAIITIDDDIIYPSTLIEKLFDAHNKDNTAIIAASLFEPLWDKQSPLPYTTWETVPKDNVTLWGIPLGVSGILYPPFCLESKMLNYTLAKRYAPLADDVWFWAAGIAKQTRKRKLAWSYQRISFDALYQYFHKGSALQHSNVKGKGEITNDNQIQAVLQYLRNEHKLPSI